MSCPLPVLARCGAWGDEHQSSVTRGGVRGESVWWAARWDAQWAARCCAQWAAHGDARWAARWDACCTLVRVSFPPPRHLICHLEVDVLEGQCHASWSDTPVFLL